VSIVPCLAKKYEAVRPEFAPDGIRDVDAVLTTSELLEMLKLARIDTKSVKPAEFDEPYKRVTGAGILFGASGGVAEAALRMAVEKLTGVPLVDHLDFEEIRGFQGLKEATVEAAGKKVRVAVISGLNNVEPIAEKIINGEDVGYDLIEVMACPGGCICGAGHPVPEKVDSLENRQQVLVNIDKASQYRKSQENPDILRLYTNFYGEANSERAHHLLHTHYHQVKGDSASCESAIKRKADSTFVTHEFTVCICDDCVAKGSKELYTELNGRLRDLKMDSFVGVKTLRNKENHPDSGILVMIDNKRIDPLKLTDLYKSTMS
jgi:formate dehydrogenase major subunit